MSFTTIEKFCLQCSKKLKLNNNRDIERKKFCSKSCRQTWRAYNEENTIQALKRGNLIATKITGSIKSLKTNRICEHCTKEYITTSARQKWCKECALVILVYHFLKMLSFL